MRTFLLAVAFGLAASAESEWTRFRGANGSGISTDGKLPTELGKDKGVVWKTDTLKGHSSPIVSGGKLWITGYERDELALLCYDAASGKLLWRQGVTRTRNEDPHPLNGPVTPTPVTDGRSVFAFFPEFGLIAYDFDGKELWRVPIPRSGSIQGLGSSPVYVDGLLLLQVDTPEQAYVVAFDATKGKQVWKADRPIGFMGSYATPSIYKPAKGPTQVIVAGALEVTAYQAKTGERLWWARGLTMSPANLPLVAGDYVYTLEPVPDSSSAPPFAGMLSQFDKNKNGTIELSEITGDSIDEKIMSRVFKSIDSLIGNKDGMVTEGEFKLAFNPSELTGGLVRTRLDGRGDVAKTHVGWRHTKGLPYVTAPILYDGILYVVRNGGILSTFDPATGKLLREERLKDALGEYYAQPVAGDGKIYFVSKEGKVTVVKAGANWEVLSSNTLEEDVIASPAIAGSRIYLRTNQHLYCFGSAATGRGA